MAKSEIHWKAEYRKLVNVLGQLEKTISSQAELLRIRHSQLEQAQKAVDIAKQTLRNAIEGHAQREAEHIKIIDQLRNKLKEFGFADFDNLGN